jgi:MerR family transcriptional regulator, heat shock protein HspR
MATMTQPIIPRDRVAERLAVPVRVLVRYEARGLIRAGRDALGVEGYGPSEVRRAWTIWSCQRDLGINLAGVEAILKLRDHLEQVHRRLRSLAVDLNEALEAAPDRVAEGRRGSGHGSGHGYEHQDARDDDA